LLWGGLMGLLSTLPAVGAALIWLPTAIWLALSGAILKGVVLVLFGVLVLGNTDNVVRTLMLSGKARMSALVLFISLMGGVVGFGFIGVVLGPLVAAVLTAMLKVYAQLLEEEPDTRPEAPPGAVARGAAPVAARPKATQ
jgi:predicted PurR-regulated permease PerM